MKKGIDLSHHNNVSDWDKVKTDFIIYKATQGTGYVDPTMKSAKKEILQRGIEFGLYHFADGGDAKKEADHFCSVAGDVKWLVLDWEINHPDPVGWCTTFIDRVKEKKGVDCWLYTNDFRARTIPFPGNWKFWIARYGVNDGTMNKRPAFENWTIHQYTSKGRQNGIEGFVDLNEMKAEATEPELKYYSQRDPRWKNKKLGFSNLSIGNYGCFLTALSMMVGKEPLVVNEILKAANAFDGARIISDRAAKALDLEYEGINYGINDEPDWMPNIKEVDMSPSPGKQQHFVVRDRMQGRKVIIDPWDGEIKPIGHYPFISYRLFKKKTEVIPPVDCEERIAALMDTIEGQRAVLNANQETIKKLKSQIDGTQSLLDKIKALFS